MSLSQIVLLQIIVVDTYHMVSIATRNCFTSLKTYLLEHLEPSDSCPSSSLSATFALVLSDCKISVSIFMSVVITAIDGGFQFRVSNILKTSGSGQLLWWRNDHVVLSSMIRLFQHHLLWHFQLGHLYHIMPCLLHLLLKQTTRSSSLLKQSSLDLCLCALHHRHSYFVQQCRGGMFCRLHLRL